MWLQMSEKLREQMVEEWDEYIMKWQFGEWIVSRTRQNRKFHVCFFYFNKSSFFNDQYKL